LLQAFASIVGCMQRCTRELAYHAIAHVRDWHNRSDMWAAAGLPPIEHVRVCAFEPRGAYRDAA
jgi:hypothetical protein